MDDTAIGLIMLHLQNAREGWCVCVTPAPRRSYPDGSVFEPCFWWGLVSPEGYVVASHPDFNSDELLDVNHWLLPLTGYTREEFIREIYNAD